MVESYGLLNDIFPFPSILNAGYPIFNLHLANYFTSYQTLDLADRDRIDFELVI